MAIVLGEAAQECRCLVGHRGGRLHRAGHLPLSKLRALESPKVDGVDFMLSVTKNISAGRS